MVGGKKDDNGKISKASDGDKIEVKQNKTTKPTPKDVLSKSEGSDEEFERPDWDEEKYRNKTVKSKAENDEEFERPDWDDETWRGKLKKLYYQWWNNQKARYGTIAGLVVLLLVFIIPPTRYTILNTAGVRASARIVVVDMDTQQPLRAVNVTLSGTTTETSSQGLAYFNSIKLGSQELTIEKSAYQSYSQTVTIGWGENDFETISIDPVGTQYSFMIVDWLSNQPLRTVPSVNLGESSAVADSSGLATINILPPEGETVTFSIEAEGYLSQNIETSVSVTETTEVKLVIDRPHFFVSRRDGKYDLYRSNADGSEQTMFVAATGNEVNDVRFSVAPNNNHAALVATRGKEKNADGYRLRGLHIVNLEDGSIVKIDSSERIDFIGWSGPSRDSLIYVKIAAGASGTNPNRHRLVSYNVSSGQSTELAASNYFNDILVAGEYVFYAPSDAYKDVMMPYLFRVSASGNNQITVHDKEVWTVLRDNFDNIRFDSGQDWYTSPIGAINPVMSEAPQNFTSRLYTDNIFDDNLSAWTEVRDGKGVLLIRNADTGQDKVIHTQAGLRNPLHWLDSQHLIYRVLKDGETADYVINVEAGDPVKISDVTNVSGIDRWYYYY